MATQELETEVVLNPRFPIQILEMVLCGTGSFSEAVVCRRAALQAQLDEYVVTNKIPIPDFAQIKTYQQLFETGWRFHKTHSGILVPPGFFIDHEAEQQTVVICCQVSGASVTGWENRAYLLENPLPSVSRSGRTVREKLFVCAEVMPWLKRRWGIVSQESR